MSHTKCIRCESIRIMNVESYSSESHYLSGVNKEGKNWSHSGLCPAPFGASWGESFMISFCLDSGQVQMTFRVRSLDLETKSSDDDISSEENE